MQYLNDLIPAPSAYRLETATAINDLGQIVVTGTLISMCKTKTLVLTPVL